MTQLSLQSCQQAALDVLAFGERAGRPCNADVFGALPCVYLRTPTGGGKTVNQLPT